MMHSSLIVLAILLATTLEAFGMPWLGLLGLSLPLAIWGLAIGSLILPRNWLPWLAVICGLVLDVNSVAPLGMWAVYSLLSVWIFDRVNQAQPPAKRAWWPLLLATLTITGLAPLYGAVLAHEEVSLDHSLGWQMLGRILVVLPLALSGIWLVQRRMSA